MKATIDFHVKQIISANTGNKLKDESYNYKDVPLEKQ